MGPQDRQTFIDILVGMRLEQSGAECWWNTLTGPPVEHLTIKNALGLVHVFTATLNISPEQAADWADGGYLNQGRGLIEALIEDGFTRADLDALQERLNFEVINEPDAWSIVLKAGPDRAHTLQPLPGLSFLDSVALFYAAGLSTSEIVAEWQPRIRAGEDVTSRLRMLAALRSH